MTFAGWSIMYQRWGIESLDSDLSPTYVDSDSTRDIQDSDVWTRTGPDLVVCAAEDSI
jgi:hypothetical protein